MVSFDLIIVIIIALINGLLYFVNRKLWFNMFVCGFCFNSIVMYITNFYKG